MAKDYFFDPTFLGRANENSFWLKISEIWQKSSKGTNLGTNLGTTFLFLKKMIFLEFFTKK